MHVRAHNVSATSTAIGAFRWMRSIPSLICASTRDVNHCGENSQAISHQTIANRSVSRWLGRVWLHVAIFQIHTHTSTHTSDQSFAIGTKTPQTTSLHTIPILSATRWAGSASTLRFFKYPFTQAHTHRTSHSPKFTDDFTPDNCNPLCNTLGFRPGLAPRCDFSNTPSHKHKHKHIGPVIHHWHHHVAIFQNTPSHKHKHIGPVIHHWHQKSTDDFIPDNCNPLCNTLGLGLGLAPRCDFSNTPSHKHKHTGPVILHVNWSPTGNKIQQTISIQTIANRSVTRWDGSCFTLRLFK